MKTTVVFVLACVCFCAAAKVPTKPPKFDYRTPAYLDFLNKQKVILEVLQHVHQSALFPKFVDDANSFNWTDLVPLYEDTTVITNYLALQKVGLLERGEEFSVLRKSHIEQAVALFRCLHQAPDWETFYKVLVWARVNVNEGVFVYAVNVAVLHRPDFEGIALPTPYEIYPYYFFNAETIQAAQNAKCQSPSGKKSSEVNLLIINSNYTGWPTRANAEQALSYFTEDVGLNAWYYYFHSDYPFWVDNKDSLIKSRRGEVYLYTHAQLLARYYLERLSNNLGEIPQFSWRTPFRTGYNPALAYYRGTAFPVRNNFYSVNNENTYYPIEKVESLEARVQYAIEHQLFTLPNGTNVDLSKPDSVEYFANLYKLTTPAKKNIQLFGLLEVLGRTLLLQI